MNMKSSSYGIHLDGQRKVTKSFRVLKTNLKFELGTSQHQFPRFQVVYVVVYFTPYYTLVLS